MKNLKSLAVAISAFLAISSANYCNASGCYVQDLKALNPAPAKALEPRKIYDASENFGGIPGIERQVRTVVCDRVIERMEEDAREGGNLRKIYLGNEGIHSAKFARVMIGFPDSLFKGAIWNSNGGDMSVSFNGDYRLEVSYWERGLYKLSERDNLISEISNAIETALYEYAKLSFNPDFDPTVLGEN